MEGPPTCGIVARMSHQMMPTTTTTTTPTSAEPAVHPDHDRGLEFDVRTLMARRSALGLLSGAGLLALVGCPTVRPSAATTTSRVGLDHRIGDVERERRPDGIRHGRHHGGARRDGGALPR